MEVPQASTLTPPDNEVSTERLNGMAQVETDILRNFSRCHNQLLSVTRCIDRLEGSLPPDLKEHLGDRGTLRRDLRSLTSNLQTQRKLFNIHRNETLRMMCGLAKAMDKSERVVRRLWSTMGPQQAAKRQISVLADAALSRPPEPSRFCALLEAASKKDPTRLPSEPVRRRRRSTRPKSARFKNVRPGRTGTPACFKHRRLHQKCSHNPKSCSEEESKGNGSSTEELSL